MHTKIVVPNCKMFSTIFSSLLSHQTTHKHPHQQTKLISDLLSCTGKANADVVVVAMECVNWYTREWNCSVQGATLFNRITVPHAYGHSFICMCPAFAPNPTILALHFFPRKTAYS
jgi:hypothetical protein